MVPIGCQVVNFSHISHATSHNDFSSYWKMYLIIQPMIMTHGGKFNLTSTIPSALAEPATIIGSVYLHQLHLIIFEILLLYQKPISHWLHILADRLQTPSAWKVRSWTSSWFYLKRIDGSLSAIYCNMQSWPTPEFGLHFFLLCMDIFKEYSTTSMQNFHSSHVSTPCCNIFGVRYYVISRFLFWTFSYNKLLYL